MKYTNKTRTMSRRTFVMVAGAGLLALTACRPAVPPVAQPAAPAPAIPVVDIMAMEYAFKLPEKVPAGLVTLNFINHGKELHFAAASRLSKDISLADIVKQLDSPTPPDFIDQTQGMSTGINSPGLSQQITVKLVPGKYFVGCWVPAPDHMPHAAKGMVGIFEVVENKGAQAAEPAADLVITLNKDGVDFPKAVSAGKHTWKVVNASGNGDANGIEIIQLASGKTLEDAKNGFNTGDLSAIVGAFGGGGGAGPTSTVWVTLDLKPGEYWMDTSVPDPKAPPPAKDQQPKTIAVQFTVK